MKRFIVFLILLIVCSIIFGQLNNYPDERTEFRRVKTNGGSSTWDITGTEDDTSEVINLFANMTVQFLFSDTSTNAIDSVAYSAKLLVSSMPYPDSSFKAYQTITSSETTHGYSVCRKLLTTPGYGKIVITGLAANKKLSAIEGNVIIRGWSNAEGMSSVLQ